MTKLLLLGATAAVLMAGPASAAANLVTDGSFERGSDGLQGWTIGGVATDGVPLVAIFDCAARP